VKWICQSCCCQARRGRALGLITLAVESVLILDVERNPTFQHFSKHLKSLPQPESVADTDIALHVGLHLPTCGEDLAGDDASEGDGKYENVDKLASLQ
jgi:hypothetical protein